MVSPVFNMTNTTKHSGVSGMATQLLVQHSAECPLEAGYAKSLTQWANTPLSQGGPVASWHSFVDPSVRVRMVPWYYAAWHANYANPFSIGIEVAGYARFTKEQWLTPAGLKQLENLAHEWVYFAEMEKIPSRWLTNAEVDKVMAGNRSIKGFCTHRQIDKATRTDPGNNFPYDKLMQRIKEIRGETFYASPTKPTPTTEDDEMPESRWNKGKRNVLKKGEWTYLRFDPKYTVVSILSGAAARKSIHLAQFQVSGLMPGEKIAVRFVVDKYSKEKTERYRSHNEQSIVASLNGGTLNARDSISQHVNLPDGSEYRIRLEAYAFKDGVAVEAFGVDSMYWK